MHRKRLIVAVSCLLMTVAMLASGTVAWLLKSQKADTAYTSLSDFEVSGTLSFQKDIAYSGSTILVPISFQAGTDNYIGDMKYVITYTGSSPAYIRVRVLEQWTDSATNEILAAGFLKYELSSSAEPVEPSEGAAPTASPIPAAGSGASSDALAEMGEWKDNRKNDYCYYYSVPVQPKMLTNTGTDSAVAIGDGKVELTLFDHRGKDISSLLNDISATSKMGLVIEVEAVQPNRYREFWGIRALPF